MMMYRITFIKYACVREGEKNGCSVYTLRISIQTYQ